MSLIRETCGCGAEWEGGSTFVQEREKFRSAHAGCRDIEIVKRAWCDSDSERNAEHVKVMVLLSMDCPTEAVA